MGFVREDGVEAAKLLKDGACSRVLHTAKDAQTWVLTWSSCIWARLADRSFYHRYLISAPMNTEVRLKTVQGFLK